MHINAFLRAFKFKHAMKKYSIISIVSMILEPFDIILSILRVAIKIMTNSPLDSYFFPPTRLFSQSRPSFSIAQLLLIFTIFIFLPEQTTQTVVTRIIQIITVDHTQEARSIGVAIRGVAQLVQMMAPYFVAVNFAAIFTRSTRHKLLQYQKHLFSFHLHARKTRNSPNVFHFKTIADILHVHFEQIVRLGSIFVFRIRVAVAIRLVQRHSIEFHNT